MKVLLVDQFTGPSPYQLQQSPVKFQDLLVDMQHLDRSESPIFYFRLIEIDETKPKAFLAPWGTVAYRENKDGNAEIFSMNVDSSG